MKENCSIIKIKLCWFVVILAILSFALAQRTSAEPISQESLYKIHAYDKNRGYEPDLLKIIEYMEEGFFKEALDQANRHVEKFPNSRVGHLLKSDILRITSSPAIPNETNSGEHSQSALIGDELKGFNIEGLREQIKRRWLHATQENNKWHTHFPDNLVEMGKHEHVMVADMTASRLYLYKNERGQPRLIKDYYLVIGSQGYGKQIEGDNKTPIGVYEVNKYIEGKKLPDLYGKGAFPVNYPNRFDRFRKRTGYGIWLHGTPSNIYARPPWASEGCFVLSNDDLLDIGQYINVEKRTPVILSDRINWVTSSELTSTKQRMMAVLENWKSDWESLDTEAYLAHYSQDNFNLGKGEYQSWASKKRATNSHKTFIKVNLELKSLFLYPGESDMFVVRYKQHYISNNYTGHSDKEQYWKRDNTGRWRIIYEG